MTFRDFFDLDATLGRDLIDAVSPASDGLARHTQVGGECVHVTDVVDGPEDSGVLGVCVHSSDTKAILSETQELLRDKQCCDDCAVQTGQTEAQELAARLKQAFAACGNNAPAVKSAIAQELGISRQAIDGWLRTGTVHKSRLSVIARHTGQSLDFLLGLADMTAAEEKEVELVLHFRDLPDVLREKLLSDAKAYIDLAQQAGQKPAKKSRK
jgi:hypothetical protein